MSNLLKLKNWNIEFHRLILREVVDADPIRMKMLANDVFKDQFYYLHCLMREIAPKQDTHLLAISVLSLCKYHVEMQPLSQHFLGRKYEHDKPSILTKHIMNLLLQRLGEE